jgi:hypothetical protein
MNQQQQLNALGKFKANWRPAPTYTKAPSKMLNHREGVEPTKLKPLFNFGPIQPQLNFRAPEQVQTIMAHLSGHEVLGGRVSN